MPLEDGLSIPEEIERRQQRKAQLAKARAEMESRAKQRAELEKAEYEAKVARRQEARDQGKKPRGKEPQAPDETPEARDQYNFTDPESRIMKAGNGNHFIQAYNAQAAVEVDSRLIVGQYVTNAPNDKHQLAAAVASVEKAAGAVSEVLVDNGYLSQAGVETVEKDTNGEATGITVLAATRRQKHGRSVEDMEKREDPKTPEPGSPFMEGMDYRVNTQAGRSRYKLRQQTVEPVFGIIKEALGFRRFSMRGSAKATLEWTLVCLAYNLKRLFTVSLKGAKA
jgi:DDE family transposase